MPIYIYNSLTRKKEEFNPLKPQEVKMYVCGPTVYDQPHIGHARSAYIFDVIRRYLNYKGYKVKFVRNVTDVDDKIIDKARKEFPDEDLNVSFKKVADKYLISYHQALESLGVGAGQDKIIEPKASDYIPKMLTFIQGLIAKQAAYVSGGDVYFDITKAKNYGKLSNQALDKMESGTRVSSAENKRNPLDFALWKSAKENEPSWDSPWGKGRPGWHIECSVMSSDILGDEFDIHGGGVDLIFPHHENEIAQSEGLGKKFARYWIHHGLLTINSQKMAKSLGNFITIEEVLKRYPADVLKMCYLTVHYGNPLDFSWERMDGAKEELVRVRECINKINYYIEERKKGFPTSRPIIKYVDFKKHIDELKIKFEDAMDDNFNTPQAKSVIFQLVTRFYIENLCLENIECLKYVKDTIISLGKILGLSFDVEDKLESELLAKIEERNKAKKAKDFEKADSIRKELEAKGIILEDTQEGRSGWRRK